MEKLNKLFAIAQRADAVGNLIECVNPHDIIDIAEEFLSLKERAEAAEAKVETENKWRDLALQFDGHRMQAISLLKMIVNDAPEKQFTSVRNFLKCGPLSGEEVMNERLLVIANSRPAPAVTLDELVPDGWKLVPVEPTWGMLAADGCAKHHDGQQCLHHKNRKRIWRAMLASAPQP